MDGDVDDLTPKILEKIQRSIEDLQAEIGGLGERIDVVHHDTQVVAMILDKHLKQFDLEKYRLKTVQDRLAVLAEVELTVRGMRVTIDELTERADASDDRAESVDMRLALLQVAMGDDRFRGIGVDDRLEALTAEIQELRSRLERIGA